MGYVITGLICLAIGLLAGGYLHYRFGSRVKAAAEGAIGGAGGGWNQTPPNRSGN